jgi:hypothetical protein
MVLLLMLLKFENLKSLKFKIETTTIEDFSKFLGCYKVFLIVDTPLNRLVHLLIFACQIGKKTNPHLRGYKLLC